MKIRELRPTMFTISQQFDHQKRLSTVIYCTKYCIKVLSDITVHLYINILFNMLYLCIQQTQTVQCRQTLCIYVCKISSTYQHFLIHIAYNMHLLNAILFPCKRWSNGHTNDWNSRTSDTDSAKEKSKQGERKELRTSYVVAPQDEQTTSHVTCMEQNTETFFCERERDETKQTPNRCTFTHQSFTKINSAFVGLVDWFAGQVSPACRVHIWENEQRVVLCRLWKWDSSFRNSTRMLSHPLCLQHCMSFQQHSFVQICKSN